MSALHQCISHLVMVENGRYVFNPDKEPTTFCWDWDDTEDFLKGGARKARKFAPSRSAIAAFSP